MKGCKKMTPYQELGLQKYRSVETEMRIIENKMTTLAINGKSNTSLVGKYNQNYHYQGNYSI